MSGLAPLTVVCAYADGSLATPWFRAYRRAKRALQNRGFNARLQLLPITDLPAEIDVIVVPPNLERVARAAPGVRDCLITSPEALAGRLVHVLERLLEEGRLDYAPAPARPVAVHLGFQAVTERARLAE
jgi:hypothetical protein